jgi:hypothetical protein
MPVPISATPWTPQHTDRMMQLRDCGFDVYLITDWLVSEFGGPKEWEVVLHQMQRQYFWETCGVDIDLL